MADGRIMKMPFQALSSLPARFRHVNNKNRTCYRLRFNVSSVLVQTDHEDGYFPKTRKISGSTSSLSSKIPNTLLSQSNTIGIIGGVSVFSTLIFMEKLIWWSSRNGEQCPPFVVCSDPELNRENSFRSCQNDSIVENLRTKRVFLEESGAHCIVMPCHLSHIWHGEISEGCSVRFLHVGECVARELKEAELTPVETGHGVRIGVVGSDAALRDGFYQEKLQKQGFEVVLPDKATMEHIIIPAIDAVHKRDIEGARNLLRIAIQILLVRAANVVILASDEMQGLLPHDDPLIKKSMDPMDSLARSAINWAKSTAKVRKKIGT
ncbi:hypothetical protein ACFE04_009613 [Oxalis oulophora]